MTHRLMIAGTHSGVGKTSVTLGLARALARRGRAVRAFKAGPDFLDALWLGSAAGHPPRNLDSWMAGAALPHVFHHAARDAELVLVEGMMGLFDGVHPSSDEGSSAHLAKRLGLPVILVVDASAMASSVAALVKGFQTFDPALRVVGVIANRVGGEAHAAMIREALLPLGLPLLGALPRMEASLPERHLGLVSPEGGASTGILDALAQHVELHADLSRLELLAREAGSLPLPQGVEDPFNPSHVAAPRGKPLRVALAHDEAFHFYYEDNLDLLRMRGAELINFSPLRDEALPHCDLLLLGGGYPEEHARALSANTRLIQSLRHFAKEGRIYAECGGLMYLARDIDSLEGDLFPMAGVLPATCVMGSRLAQIGYRNIVTEGPWLGGLSLRGHEFHYSHMTGFSMGSSACTLQHPRSTEIRSDGYQSGRIFATYAHLYWPSQPEFVEKLVSDC